MYLWTMYQATLDRFLALPCYENGRKVACDTGPGSINRAIVLARQCGGHYAIEDWNGRTVYVVVGCTTDFDDCGVY